MLTITPPEVHWEGWQERDRDIRTDGAMMMMMMMIQKPVETTYHS